MGVIRSTESLEAEAEEYRELLMRGTRPRPWKSGPDAAHLRPEGNEASAVGRMVCVTGAVSFLGFAIAQHLYSHGYSVRLALETQDDVEKLRELQMFDDRQMERNSMTVVMASVMNIDSLCKAIDGCVGVFHTSSFIDPRGVSGYTKNMAELEARAAEIVIEACVRTPTVRECVFTSSMLACVWKQSSPGGRAMVVFDENCWSDEGLCRDRKLWLALGKTMAEKAAWRAARGRNLKMVTVCPALLTGPGFSLQNSTSSIAYLKGSQELFSDGLLATVDVNKAAEAHVRVYEAGMNSGTASGRYLCFDHVVRRVDEAAELERQLRIPSRISSSSVAVAEQPTWLLVSNRKLSRLMASSRRCTYDAYVPGFC